MVWNPCGRRRKGGAAPGVRKGRRGGRPSMIRGASGLAGGGLGFQGDHRGIAVAVHRLRAAADGIDHRRARSPSRSPASTRAANDPRGACGTSCGCRPEVRRGGDDPLGRGFHHRLAADDRLPGRAADGGRHPAAGRLPDRAGRHPRPSGAGRLGGFLAGRRAIGRGFRGGGWRQGLPARLGDPQAGAILVPCAAGSAS